MVKKRHFKVPIIPDNLAIPMAKTKGMGCSLHKTSNGLVIKGSKKSMEQFFTLLGNENMRKTVIKWLYSGNIMATLEEFNPSHRKSK